MSSGFGRKFSVRLFGEDASDSIGFVIEGIAPNTRIDLHEIRMQLERARAMKSISCDGGAGELCRVLSGYAGGFAVGTPLAVIIENTPESPAAKTGVLRPSTEDLGALFKYEKHAAAAAGHFGGRLLCAITAAGSIAKQILFNDYGICVGGHIYSAGRVKDQSMSASDIDPQMLFELSRSELPLINKSIKSEIKDEIARARADEDTLGGEVECAASGLPAGIGAPLFEGIKSRIAQIVLSIPYVVGMDFGTGFDMCRLTGGRANDLLYTAGGRIRKQTNNDGGISGHFSDGEPVVVRVGFRPDPGVAKRIKTVDASKMEMVEFVPQQGDACVALSSLAAVEAAIAIALLDIVM